MENNSIKNFKSFEILPDYRITGLPISVFQYRDFTTLKIL